MGRGGVRGRKGVSGEGNNRAGRVSGERGGQGVGGRIS